MKMWKKVLGMVTGAAVLLAGYSFFWEPYHLKVTRQTVELAGVTPFRVVFFSDTHFGRWYDTKQAEKLAKTITEQQPDVVIFGGDLIDQYWRDGAEMDLSEIAEALATIQSTYGCYAIWGNHDHGGGAVRVYEQLMGEAGFTVLKNEVVAPEDAPFQLIGLDDALLGEMELPAWEPMEGRATLLLGHEPDDTALFLTDGMDLALSGHSHGGQVSLPFLTDKIMPKGAWTYSKGWYDIGGNRLFVSSGVGMTVLPLRFASGSEICVFEMGEGVTKDD